MSLTPRRAGLSFAGTPAYRFAGASCLSSSGQRYGIFRRESYDYLGGMGRLLPCWRLFHPRSEGASAAASGCHIDRGDHHQWRDGKDAVLPAEGLDGKIWLPNFRMEIGQAPPSLYGSILRTPKKAATT